MLMYMQGRTCYAYVWRAHAFLKISADTEHPLHRELLAEKGNRLKSCKSWMVRAVDVVRQVCEPTNIIPGVEWCDEVSPDLLTRMDLKG